MAYLPQDHKVWGNGKVIITTRDSNIQNTSYISPENIIQLGELSKTEALVLFSKILYSCELSNLSPDQKEQVLNFLKYIPSFPLDVSIAAYYIKNTHLTYEQYLEKITHYGKDLETIQMSVLKESTDYEKTRYGIISLSFTRLIDLNPEFKELLFFICLLDSQNIPKSLLEAYKDSKTVNSLMYELRRYSLITRQSFPTNSEINTFSLHRSTQFLGKRFLLDSLTKKKKRDWINKFVNMVKSFYDAHAGTNYKLITLLIPHLEHFLNNLDSIELNDPSIEKCEIHLLYVLGYSYYKAADNFILAKKSFEAILQKNKKNPYMTNNTIATVLKSLGGICGTIGNANESILYSKESIKLCKSIHNSSLLMIENLTTLGGVYTYRGNFKNAQYYLEIALAEIQKVKDPKMKRELESKIYGRLTTLYLRTYINTKEGRKAEQYAIKSLEVLNASSIFHTMKTPPKNLSCEVVWNKIRLGLVYSQHGKYKEAVEQGFREAQCIIDQSLDNCNSGFTKAALGMNIGDVLLREGKLTAAETELTTALKIAEKLLGSTNWLTLPAKISRAEIFIRQERLTEAYEDCVSILKQKDRMQDNYSSLLYLICCYHAAIIKYKQHDLKKSKAHFADFFKEIQKFCKGFLESKDYKALEVRGAFTITPHASNGENNDIKKYLKNSVDIFTAIYGGSHPFVRDYITPNYNAAVKPWYKFS